MSSAVTGSMTVGSAQAPEITSRPCGRNGGWHACTSSGRPTHSIATSYPPGSASETAATASVAPAVMLLNSALLTVLAVRAIA